MPAPGWQLKALPQYKQ